VANLKKWKIKMKIKPSIALVFLLCSFVLHAASLDKEAQELASNDIPFDHFKPTNEDPWLFNSQTILSFKPHEYALWKLTEYKGACIEIKESGEYDFLYSAPNYHAKLGGNYRYHQRLAGKEARLVCYDLYNGDRFLCQVDPDGKAYNMIIRIYQNNKDQHPQEIKKEMMNQHRVGLSLNLMSGNLVQVQINVYHWQVVLTKAEILLSPKAAEYLAKSQERKFIHLQKENDVLKQKVAEQAFSLQEAVSRLQALEATMASLLRVMDPTLLRGVTPLTLASEMSSFPPSEDTTRVPTPVGEIELTQEE
jgi:hypothetical protein